MPFRKKELDEGGAEVKSQLAGLQEPVESTGESVDSAA